MHRLGTLRGAADTVSLVALLILNITALGVAGVFYALDLASVIPKWPHYAWLTIVLALLTAAAVGGYISAFVMARNNTTPQLSKLRSGLSRSLLWGILSALVSVIMLVVVLLWISLR